VLLIGAIGLLVAFTNITAPTAIPGVNPNAREVARLDSFAVKEIFLPRPLFDRVHDQAFHDILMRRDADRLDLFLDEEGIADV